MHVIDMNDLHYVTNSFVNVYLYYWITCVLCSQCLVMSGCFYRLLYLFYVRTLCPYLSVNLLFSFLFFIMFYNLYLDLILVVLYIPLIIDVFLIDLSSGCPWG
jgi:hypothetical protein